MMKDEWCVHYNGTVNDRCKADHAYADVMRPMTNTEVEALAERQRIASEEPPSRYGSSYAVPNPELFGQLNRVPCFLRNGDLRTCADCRFPTPEEIAEREQRLREYVAKVGNARHAIMEHIKAQGLLKRDCSGVIRCPVCGGKLHYGRAGSYNGHVHAECETAGCVSWLE